MGFKNFNIDRSNLPKKSRFNFSHLCTTSLDWGKLTPIHCQRIAMGDHSDKIEVNARVRLAPMVSPTLGNIQVKTYWQFVRMSDVYKGFDHFLAALPRLVSNRNSTAIPEQLPYVSASFLQYMLCDKLYCRCQKYVRQGKNQTAAEWVFNTWRDADQMGNWVNVFYGLQHIENNVAVDPGIRNFLPNNMFGFIDSPNVDKNTDYFEPKEADFRVFNHTDGDDGTFFGKYTRRGMALYNAFVTCGLIPKFHDDRKMDATPLFAMYKAYYDIMMPQYKNWESTFCYRLIKYYDVNGVTLGNCPQMTNWGENMNSELMTLWYFFFRELSDLVYFADNDFLSSLINPMFINGSFENYDDIREASLVGANGERSLIPQLSGHTGSDTANILNPKGVLDTSSNGHALFSQVTDDWLKRVYKYSNAKSALGMAIKSVMLARGLTDFVEETDSQRVGVTSNSIVVDEVISTADTETRQLGDYGGIASDSKLHGSFVHKSNSIGYYFGFATVVPEDSNFVNGTDVSSYNTRPEEFYSGMIDGLGYEGVPKTAVGVQNFCELGSGSSFDSETTLGLTPRHTAYKISRDIMHGCFNLASHRNSLSAYHLHKLLPINADLYDDDTYVYDDNNKKFTDSASDSFLSRNVFPLANPDWYRRVDGSVTSGHYDRIFYENSDADDAYNKIYEDNVSYPEPQFMALFVIQHYSDCRMLPVEDTWQTTDEDCNDKKVSITKA